ncbi:MAG: Calx-beta domain-containing protein, partial [Chthoniobacterales bacterium]
MCCLVATKSTWRSPPRAALGAFETADGTATTKDNDYTSGSDTLRFEGVAGETKTVTVLVNGDTKVEHNETFLVKLSHLDAGELNVTL